MSGEPVRRGATAERYELRDGDCAGSDCGTPWYRTEIREGDQLIEAKLTDGNSEVLIANRNGRTIRFHEKRVRAMLRASEGVAGIEIDDDGGLDQVTGMICVEAGDQTVSVLVVSENGYGKRSPVEDYRLVSNRGGKGVATMAVSEKTGKVVTIQNVRDADDLIITTKNGITIRMPASDIRVMGRATQGVKVIRLDEGEEIGDVALIRDVVTETEEVEILENGETVVPIGDTTDTPETDIASENGTEEVAE